MSRHFFSKYLPYGENVNFVRFQWKLIFWGNLMWRTWWFYWILFVSHHFFFKMAAIARMSNLPDFNENWYHEVIWRYYQMWFHVTIFLSEAVVIMANCYTLVDRWAIQAPMGASNLMICSFILKCDYPRLRATMCLASHECREARHSNHRSIVIEFQEKIVKKN